MLQRHQSSESGWGARPPNGRGWWSQIGRVRARARPRTSSLITCSLSSSDIVRLRPRRAPRKTSAQREGESGWRAERATSGGEEKACREINKGGTTAPPLAHPPIATQRESERRRRRADGAMSKPPIVCDNGTGVSQAGKHATRARASWCSRLLSHSGLLPVLFTAHTALLSLPPCPSRRRGCQCDLRATIFQHFPVHHRTTRPPR